MKKKNTALYRTILIVGVLAVFSYLANQAFNPEFSAEMPVSIDVSKVGDFVIEKVGQLIRAFLSPERRSW